MKLLMWYCTRFAFLPAQKALDSADNQHGPREYFDAAVGFIHAEADDPEKVAEVEKKLLKNLKWIAGKNNTRVIILHSFSHLSESKADPGWTREMFNRVQERLEAAGYHVIQTPFGWFLDLDMAAPGHSLARIFKAF
jgi:hypothetical protein